MHWDLSKLWLICFIHVFPQAFAQTLQQSRGFGSEFRFPDRPAGATGGIPGAAPDAAGGAAAFGNAADGAVSEEDDLYD